MPKGTPSKPRKKAASRKKGKDKEVPVLDQLDAHKDTMKAYGNAKATQDKYGRYLKNGAIFLAAVVKEKGEKAAKLAAAGTTQSDPESVDLDLLAAAFGEPNSLSAKALELYLIQKCVVEGLKQGTAEGIQAAYAKYWDQFGGEGKYAVEYAVDDEGVVTGNPARSYAIREFIDCIKNRERQKGAAATRHHAEAVMEEDMKKMMDWSEKECSAEAMKQEPKSSTDLHHQLTHSMFRAFMTSGFTLWTRNNETCTLQERDITDNCTGPAPHHAPYTNVFLDNRKGWQKAQGYDAPSPSNSYQIYEQKETPHIDMYSHLTQWRARYKRELQRDFEDDDYVFPYIAPNGVIHPKRPMTHETAQALLDKFAAGAGLSKALTTHSLRRGGAQYRFMFAPLGERWSLTIVRWWGDWAQGEHVDTLIKYLINALQSYESGHGDALNPHRLRPDLSFMGEHSLKQPATTGELRDFATKICTQLDDLRLSNSIQNAPQTPFNPAAYANNTAYIPLSQTPPQRTQIPMRDAYPPQHQQSLVNHGGAYVPHASRQQAEQPQQVPLLRSGTYAPHAQAQPQHSLIQGGLGMPHGQLPHVPHAGYHGQPPHIPHAGYYWPAASGQQYPSGQPIPPPRPSLSVAAHTRYAEARIPALKPGAEAWKEALKQWYHGDPANDMRVAMRDWPLEWYTGSMRLVTGCTYSKRKLLADEYERLGSNETAFQREYGDVCENLTKLLAAVRLKQNCKTRARKQG